jgi:GMP synthase-like glutamine amidotransferase
LGSHLIARRVRELKVYCELYSCLVAPELLEEVELVGVILSGGPASVYEEGSPHVDPKVSLGRRRRACVPQRPHARQHWPSFFVVAFMW